MIRLDVNTQIWPVGRPGGDRLAEMRTNIIWSRLILTAKNLTPVFPRTHKSVLRPKSHGQKTRTDGEVDGGKSLDFADLRAAVAPKLSGLKGSQASVIDGPVFDAYGGGRLDPKDLFHSWLAANFLLSDVSAKSQPTSLNMRAMRPAKPGTLREYT